MLSRPPSVHISPEGIGSCNPFNRVILHMGASISLTYGLCSSTRNEGRML